MPAICTVTSICRCKVTHFVENKNKDTNFLENQCLLQEQKKDEHIQIYVSIKVNNTSKKQTYNCSFLRETQINTHGTGYIKQ